MLSLRELTQEYLQSLRLVKEIPRDFQLRESSDIVALIGPRRVGKTFTMLKAVEKLLSSGRQVIYLSFDEPALRDIGKRELAELARKEFPEGVIHLFLDEVQEWRDWDSNLRWLHDVKDFRIYVTGSSSALLSSEIPSRLRGRYVSRLLLPLSFREVFREDVTTFRGRGKALSVLEEYLKWGGFPEVWMSRSREKVVSILNSIFYRDIVERYGIRDTEVFRAVMNYVIGNYSNQITYRGIVRLLKGLRIGIDVKTVANYVEYMKNSFLIFLCEIFTYSTRKRIVNPKKIYVVDPAIISLYPQGADAGRIIENVTYLELLRRLGPEEEIHYYRTRRGGEVDFLITKSGVPKEVIEVSHAPEPQHYRKVAEAMNELRVRKGLIITWRVEDEVKVNGRKVEAVPLWKWILKR